MGRKTMILLLCLALLLSACGGTGKPAEPGGNAEMEGSARADDTSESGQTGSTDLLAGREEGPSAPAEPSSEEALDALAQFSVALFQNSGAGERGTLLSPTSVLFALGMTANGARGETLAQFEDAFGLTVDELNDALAAWDAALPDDESCRVHLASALWLRDTEDLVVEEAFLDAVARDYRAEVRQAPFDAGTREEINAWVSDETKGMIDSILDEIPQSAMLYLVNALAFEAQWSEIYTTDQIHSGTFTAWNGEEQAAELMYSTEYAYLTDGSATGFLKYYDGGRYAFAALMPEEGTSLEAYVSGLTGGRLRETLAGALAEPVVAGIPKFEAETSLDLVDTLRAMGVTDAFDPACADLSAMGHTESSGALAISRVLHRTYLAVDEQGTRAGAATAVEARAGGAMLDHIPSRWTAPSSISWWTPRPACPSSSAR